MLLSKTVMVKWNGSVKKHYENKGYVWTKQGDEFECKIEDVHDNCKELIKYKCDYCGEKEENTYQRYLSNRNKCIIKKDACKKCKYEKMKEANLAKYGVENVKQLEENKEKARQTQLERYGSTNVMKLDEFKDKLKNTLNDKYGVDNVMELDSIKNKIKQTNLERYGVECTLNTDENKNVIKSNFIDKYGVPYYSMTEECKEKVKNTNNEKFGKDYFSQTEEWVDSVKQCVNEKYGVDNISQSQEVKIKKAETFFKNSSVATSRQQRYLHNLLGGVLNYSNETPSLDIAFPNEKIYIEFNGSGHDLCVKNGQMTQKEFDNRERARYYYLRDRGWKCFIINSPRDYLPSDDIIINEVCKAKQVFKLNERNCYVMNIGMFINDDKYGKLRKIKE